MSFELMGMPGSIAPVFAITSRKSTRGEAEGLSSKLIVSKRLVIVIKG
jgi:hypothetical protein